jgi:hypothetical protein
MSPCTTSPIRSVKPALQSIPDGSAYLDVPVAAFYDLIAMGELDAVKRGQRTYVTTESMDAYVARLPKAHINLSRRGAERLAKAESTAVSNAQALERLAEARIRVGERRSARARRGGEGKIPTLAEQGCWLSDRSRSIDPESHRWPKAL